MNAAPPDPPAGTDQAPQMETPAPAPVPAPAPTPVALQEDDEEWETRSRASLISEIKNNREDAQLMRARLEVLEAAIKKAGTLLQDASMGSTPPPRSHVKLFIEKFIESLTISVTHSGAPVGPLMISERQPYKVQIKIKPDIRLTHAGGTARVDFSNTLTVIRRMGFLTDCTTMTFVLKLQKLDGEHWVDCVPATFGPKATAGIFKLEEEDTSKHTLNSITASAGGGIAGFGEHPVIFNFKFGKGTSGRNAGHPTFRLAASLDMDSLAWTQRWERDQQAPPPIPAVFGPKFKMRSHHAVVCELPEGVSKTVRRKRSDFEEGEFIVAKKKGAPKTKTIASVPGGVKDIEVALPPEQRDSKKKRKALSVAQHAESQKQAALASSYAASAARPAY